MYQVGTWRPAQVSPIAKMRRFFLGGCQLMSDPSYLAVGTPAATQVFTCAHFGRMRQLVYAKVFGKDDIEGYELRVEICQVALPE